jgi:hypothetical protein
VGRARMRIRFGIVAENNFDSLVRLQCQGTRQLY